MMDDRERRRLLAEGWADQRRCNDTLTYLAPIERHLKRGNVGAALKSLARMRRRIERQRAEAQEQCRKAGFDPWPKSHGEARTARLASDCRHPVRHAKHP